MEAVNDLGAAFVKAVRRTCLLLAMEAAGAPIARLPKAGILGDLTAGACCGGPVITTLAELPESMAP